MRVALLLLAVIVGSEIGIMLLFSWLDVENFLSPLAEVVADALLLSTLISLPLYYLVIKPLRTTIKTSQAKLNMLASAVENAGDGIIITDRKGTIEYVNQAFRNMSFYNDEDVIGQPASTIEAFMETETWKKNFLQSIRLSGIWKDEQWERRKDGEKYLAEITVTPIDLNGNGRISHFVTIKQDNTKKFELESQLRQAQKMEAVGTLVGGIAHDFNNMLSGLTGQLYLVKGQVKDNPEVLDRLSKMETLSYRAADMVSQLLTFARKGVVNKTNLALNSFIKEACKLAQVGLPENIKFKCEVPDQNLVVHADATQLQQVMMNMINNARDALDGIQQPEITVTLHWVASTDARLQKFTNGPGEYALLCMTDNGSGIEKRHLSKIMEPFFTTKEQGKGTGLGLAMVHGVVKTHHGFFDVESRVGQGTVFYIYIPLVVGETGPLLDSNTGALHIGHGETILLADDDLSIRETGKDILEHLGYKVILAEDGAQAIELYRQYSDAISAVIMDIVMPKVQGVEAMLEIKKRKPNLPVILVTGYDRQNVLDKHGKLMADVIVSKPYSVEKISKILHKLASTHSEASA
ncbi:hybrid sensor histidine kinase/response regulator [Mariprofundus ferrooxydans]|uniref:hybrid sensor histidine kinase/response regulator n=1 Tax=Mariprofundus ferrooxydans TaxID=314344 RepID=UPI0006A7539B|nr:ATP-binding protein [Mariprofundus ferrooxydans]KON48555.1 histidine kinase [Mariprofundus ferrooxydans]